MADWTVSDRRVYVDLDYEWWFTHCGW